MCSYTVLSKHCSNSKNLALTWLRNKNSLLDSLLMEEMALTWSISAPLAFTSSVQALAEHELIKQNKINSLHLRTLVQARAGPIEGVGIAPSLDETIKSLENAIASKEADSVSEVLNKLAELGWARKWKSSANTSRRTTFIRELTTLGIKNAENLAVPSVRNDAAFLATVVGSTSLIAVLGSQLPGDWGFFVPYLVGASSLVVLAIGSVSPGLLQAAINGFSSAFPDYQERLLRHEAAHFLAAYLVGLPIIGYSLDIGKEHVNLIDEKLQRRLYQGALDAKELDRLAVVSMAGLAAEGLKYDKVIGQSADLFTLQRLMNKSKPTLSADQQQNLTRWAVLYSGALLKNNAKSYEVLINAMSEKNSVFQCIKAIEGHD